MYSPSTPFSQYMQVEQIKYPELTFDAIETLKKDLKDDRSLPPISGQRSCFINYRGLSPRRIIDYKNLRGLKRLLIRKMNKKINIGIQCILYIL